MRVFKPLVIVSLVVELLIFPALLFAAKDGVEVCRDETNADLRLACYDNWVDAQSELVVNAKSVSSEAIDDENLPQSKQVNENIAKQAAEINTTDPEELFGRPDAEAMRIVESTLAIVTLDEVKASVTNLSKNASKKYRLELSNGQMWKQLDNKPLYLKKGDLIAIRTASMGSYLLSKQTGSVSIRVKRID